MPAHQNIKIQRGVLLVALILFILKVAAFFITRSVAILTDALESTVNVIAGFIGLYSLIVASRPKDKDHPYGHGKAEFLSAAVEGVFITLAGLLIIYEAITHLFHPQEIQSLDIGIVLVGIAGAINFFVGRYSIKKGKQNKSMALLASGKHLLSDTYTSIGLIAGLLLIHFTHLVWLDSVIAILFALIIIFTGYKILRSSIAGIMDEADQELLKEMINVLNENRRENWVDLHNLRVIKYGGNLHVDCHLTVPWYLNVNEAHAEIDILDKLIRQNFGPTLELLVHADACLPTSCPICSKENCHVRQQPFQKKVSWTLENVLLNKKHSLN